MPVKLKPAEIARVSNAIIGTFPDPAQLRSALQPILGTVGPEAGADLDLPGGAYFHSAWKLVEKWNARGLITDLVGGLRRAAPHSPDFKRLQREWFSTTSADTETVELQGFVKPWLGHLPADAWLDELRRRMRAVCRVEFAGYDPPGVGTGFLIDKNLVLTAHHVVEMMSRQPLLADDAICRFECLNDVDKCGVAVRLRRPKFREDESPPGGNELTPGGAEPTPDELDYSLLRLEHSIDAEPFHVAPAAAAIDDPIVVLQHPRRAPLRISLGRVSGFNAGQTRLKHGAATEKGSSGAPCLNQDLQLVGLHNAARYSIGNELADYNTAVPISPIATAVAAKGFRLRSASQGHVTS